MVPLEATQVNGGTCSNKLYEKLVFAKFPPHKHIFVITLFTFIVHVLSEDTCLWTILILSYACKHGKFLILTAISNQNRDRCWPESEEMGSPSDLPAAGVLCDGHDVRTRRSLRGPQFPLLRGDSCSKL